MENENKTDQENKQLNEKDVLSNQALKSNINNNDIGGGEEKKRKKKKKKPKKKNKKDESKEKSPKKKPVKKSVFSNEQFIINGNYNLIKMLGFGAFGEIHLAYDTAKKELRAIKFEVANHKNPQLKHEYLILDTLNKPDANQPNLEIVGVPKVYGFDRMENKYNYLIMDFLGPSLSDLYQLREKNFTPETILMIAIQMLTRIEFIHEKGFIHRDIKPENFVIGLNEKSNIIHIIDFGLSKRYKDKNSGQHIPYRENRHLVGTVRYASINAHLGIEQSRRDDLESIGYVLVYFYLGRLPWQSNLDKGKPQTFKILDKKLITPPEILCKKMPSQFSYFFHYCKNLKFEDRPDYLALKTLFAEVLYSRVKIGSIFTFDWFNDEKDDDKKKEKNYSDTNLAAMFNKGGETPGDSEGYSPKTYSRRKFDKSSAQNPNGITEQLKINTKIINNGFGDKQEHPLGIQTGRNDSKGTVSESDSEESGNVSDDKGAKEKNSSDSNYNIIKSESSDAKIKAGEKDDNDVKQEAESNADDSKDDSDGDDDSEIEGETKLK